MFAVSGKPMSIEELESGRLSSAIHFGREVDGERLSNLGAILSAFDVENLYTAKVSSANDQIAEEDWKDFPW